MPPSDRELSRRLADLFRQDLDEVAGQIPSQGSQVINRQTTRFRQTKGKQKKLYPIKILFSYVEGSERLFFIGGDRPTPARIHSIPASASVRSAGISNIGPGLRDYIIGINYATPSSAVYDSILVTLYGNQPSKNWQLQARGTNQLVWRGQGFWSSDSIFQNPIYENSSTQLAQDILQDQENTASICIEPGSTPPAGPLGTVPISGIVPGGFSDSLDFTEVLPKSRSFYNAFNPQDQQELRIYDFAEFETRDWVFSSTSLYSESEGLDCYADFLDGQGFFAGENMRFMQSRREFNSVKRLLDNSDQLINDYFLSGEQIESLDSGFHSGFGGSAGAGAEFKRRLDDLAYKVLSAHEGVIQELDAFNQACQVNIRGSRSKQGNQTQQLSFAFFIKNIFGNTWIKPGLSSPFSSNEWSYSKERISQNIIGPNDVESDSGSSANLTTPVAYSKNFESVFVFSNATGLFKSLLYRQGAYNELSGQAEAIDRIVGIKELEGNISYYTLIENEDSLENGRPKYYFRDYDAKLNIYSINLSNYSVVLLEQPQKEKIKSLKAASQDINVHGISYYPA